MNGSSWLIEARVAPGLDLAFLEIPVLVPAGSDANAEDVVELEALLILEIFDGLDDGRISMEFNPLTAAINQVIYRSE